MNMPIKIEVENDLTREGVMERIAEAKEKGIRLKLENLNLENLDLSLLDFSGAQLTNLRMPQCLFLGTNFHGARLDKVNCWGGNFFRVNFQDAIIVKPGESVFWDAIFESTNFLGADFSNACMFKAVFVGANITEMIFPTGSKIVDLEGVLVHIESDHVSIGSCHYYIEEWLEFTDDQIGNMCCGKWFPVGAGAIVWWNKNKDTIFSIADDLQKREQE